MSQGQDSEVKAQAAEKETPDTSKGPEVVDVSRRWRQIKQFRGWLAQHQHAIRLEGNETVEALRQLVEEKFAPAVTFVRYEVEGETSRVHIIAVPSDEKDFPKLEQTLREYGLAYQRLYRVLPNYPVSYQGGRVNSTVNSRGVPYVFGSCALVTISWDPVSRKISQLTVQWLENDKLGDKSEYPSVAKFFERHDQPYMRNALRAACWQLLDNLVFYEEAKVPWPGWQFRPPVSFYQRGSGDNEESGAIATAVLKENGGRRLIQLISPRGRRQNDRVEVSDIAMDEEKGLVCGLLKQYPNRVQAQFALRDQGVSAAVELFDGLKRAIDRQIEHARQARQEREKLNSLGSQLEQVQLTGGGKATLVATAEPPVKSAEAQPPAEKPTRRKTAKPRRPSPKKG